MGHICRDDVYSTEYLHIPAILAIIMSAVIMSQSPDAYRGLVQFGTIAGAFAVIYIFSNQRGK